MIVPVGVIRPIDPRSDSVNQRFPSGPVTIVYGRLSGCSSGNSTTDVAGTGPAVAAPGSAISESESAKATSVETVHRPEHASLPLSGRRSKGNLTRRQRNA